MTGMSTQEPAAQLLADLTGPQREAVERTEGPLLILAAAGSGKTRVITRRIAYLVALGIPSWQILALTFTNKAAGEMRERVAHLLGSRRDGERLLCGLTITTFHALCARLLRRYCPLMEGRAGWALKADYTIYDTDDQLALMKKVIAGAELSTTNWPARSVLSAISTAKNELLDAAAFAEGARDFNARMHAKLYTGYERGLRAANAVDFDDLLLLTVRMLRECAEARAEVQARWRYLMIDEYQDTNRAQLILSTLLCAGEPAPDAAGGAERPPNICVVGDPDQSIYGWRGADISNILEFEERYPRAHVIALGQNFRSTAPILGAADALIRNNKRRKHKPLFTARPAPGCEKPTVVACRDEHHEASLVVDFLRARREGERAGVIIPGEEEQPAGAARRAAEPAWKDMAVFYRNNALSRVMEDGLRAAGIPYIVARGTAFYQREEVKDALAYLRLLANPADDVSLRRIVNKPARKISKTTVDLVETFAEREEIPMLEAMSRAREIAGLDKAAPAVLRFVELIDGWSGHGAFMGANVAVSLSELVGRVIKESGLEDLYAVGPDAPEKEQERIENLREIVSAAADFEASYDAASDPAMDAPRVAPAAAGEPADTDPFQMQTPPLLAMLRGYLEQVTLIADADAVDPASGAVTLMTLHAAKGLEFDSVAIVGLEEGLLPGMRAMESPEQVEEERRLFFVGITRAMESLLVTSARYRAHRGVTERTIPSRFLRELPDEHVTFSDQSDIAAGWDGGSGRGRRGGDDFEDGWAGDDTGWEQDIDQRLERARRTTRAGGGRGGGGDSQESAGGLTVGCLVRHPQFGVGRVATLTSGGANARAAIDFQGGVGRKTLILQYARLTKI